MIVQSAREVPSSTLEEWGPGSLVVGVADTVSPGPLAWAIARVSPGNRVIVVHAIAGEPDDLSADSIDDLRSSPANASVAAMVRALDLHGVDALLKVKRAAPAEAILEVAGPEDLVVVGAGSRGPASRLLRGGVVHDLLEQARCPVAVVPSDWTGSTEAKPQVVVGWDGSRGSHEALRWASAEARRVNGRLVLVRAFRGTDVTSASSQTAAAMLADARSVGAEHNVTDIRFAPIRATGRGTAQALEDAAENCYLLVLGASHARWLTTVAHAGIPETTAALASCPVVIMPGCEDGDGGSSH